MAAQSRTISAPLRLMTSPGSMTLPIDLDMALPWSSRMKPWVMQVRKGLPPLTPTPMRSELLNQPRCWSWPSM